MFAFLKKIYWHFQSKEKYARSLGVVIGKDCFIDTRLWPSEPYLIQIGNRVQITKNVAFFTHGGTHVLRSEIPDFDVFGRIIIKDGAYIGAYTLLMPGVVIGENSIVAAGSVVTHSVPDHVVAGGNPARIICTVEEYKEKIKQYNFHTYGLSYDSKRKEILSKTPEKFIRKSEMQPGRKKT